MLRDTNVTLSNTDECGDIYFVLHVSTMFFETLSVKRSTPSLSICAASTSLLPFCFDWTPTENKVALKSPKRHSRT